jgi:prepilin-type N-terminal cleavage/methylation domain-containing protein
MRGAAPSRAGGFSLLEVLIAMLILSVGAASVLSLFAAAASTHRRAVDRTHAALVAERVLAEVRHLYVPGRTPQAIVEELPKRLPEEIDGYRHETVAFHPKGDSWSEAELFAMVTVRWRESGLERAETFQTILLPRHDLGRLEEETQPRRRR